MPKRAERATSRHRASEQIVCWRVERLRAAGFEPELAERVASHPGYDLHALLELLDKGCSAELAARILAPLEDGELW